MMLFTYLVQISFFLFNKHISCYPSDSCLRMFREWLPIRQFSLFFPRLLVVSSRWSVCSDALTLEPSPRCCPPSPGRRVTYTWLSFTPLEKLDRGPRTGFVSMSRHNISLWSGRIARRDSALGWQIHKFLGDLFLCKYADMTQIILM